MRNRSTIDMLVDNAIREFEEEFESEVGARFFTPSTIGLYKWKVYTSVDLSGNDWRPAGEETARRALTPDQAKEYEEACLRRLAPIQGPLVARVAVRRCVFEDGKWKSESPGHCRQIEVVTLRISTCEGRVPREC